ncbi:hypothetical protein ACFLWA_09045 [Chloroflexota bacterium]
MKKAVRALLALLAVVLVTGSGALAPAAGRPAYAASRADGPTVAISPKAALRLVEKVTAAGQKAVETGELNLTVTDKEVTSFLNILTMVSGQLGELQNLGDVEGLQELAGGAEAAELQQLLSIIQQGEGATGLDASNLTLRLTIKEPEVRFTAEGRIEVGGYVAVLFWRWPVSAVVAPRASEGEIVLDFVEGDLGPISMPEVVFDLVGKGLAQGILAGQDYGEVTKINVSEGKLTIRGRYNK